MDQPSPDGPSRVVPDPGVRVEVTRTGGFAGLRRRWCAEPGATEAPGWIALIAQCPWDAASAGPVAPTGADRFMWSIRAQCEPGDEQQADLADEEITGAWRDLVDAVRAWRDPVAPPDADRSRSIS